jgi:deltex-like protein
VMNRCEDVTDEVEEGREEGGEEEVCAVCMDGFGADKPAWKLPDCQHYFHGRCIRPWLMKAGSCPTCSCRYVEHKGDQPDGQMLCFRHPPGALPLAGYEQEGTLMIQVRVGGREGGEGERGTAYCDCPCELREMSCLGNLLNRPLSLPPSFSTPFPQASSCQACHPAPGTVFPGTSRVGYLPATGEGWSLLLLLRRCFFRRLMFTIGTSVTTGRHGQIVWNGVHMKTSPSGGAV